MLTGPFTSFNISLVFCSKSLFFSAEAIFGLVVQPSTMPQLRISFISPTFAESTKISILDTFPFDFLPDTERDKMLKHEMERLHMGR